MADDLGHVAVSLDGSEVWRWETFNLHNLLEKLLQEFAYGNPNVAVVREWDEDIPAIHGSRAQLERVFYNLLVNAGRAMPDGGTLTLRTRRVRSLQEENGREWVLVDVADTGIGMPPEVQAKIFRIGFSDWRQGQKGSGLGLYVARRNVENHGGRLEVTSTVGVGTTFTVWLPVQPENVVGGNAPAL